MKICLIGPGIMPIPPKGWGAVEILIWDYKIVLEKLGHEVLIVNDPNYDNIINKVNKFNPDFVHLHYDVFWEVMKGIECKNKAMTSHFGYIEQDEKNSWYLEILNGFISSDCCIFSLSEGIKKCYTKRGFSENKSYVTPNGARSDLIRFEERCSKPDKSIYLAKIDYRKRQTIFNDNIHIDFVGNCVDPTFNQSASNYLGEWPKDKVYNNLTDYANLVLLSDGECHPLVTCEALMAGLGLVVSEYAAANLDIEKDFIDVIYRKDLDNKEYINKVISKNREISVNKRKEIRQYALDNFDYETVIVPKYINIVKRAFNL